MLNSSLAIQQNVTTRLDGVSARSNFDMANPTIIQAGPLNARTWRTILTSLDSWSGKILELKKLV